MVLFRRAISSCSRVWIKSIVFLHGILLAPRLWPSTWWQLACN